MENTQVDLFNELSKEVYGKVIRIHQESKMVLKQNSQTLQIYKAWT